MVDPPPSMSFNLHTPVFPPGPPSPVIKDGPLSVSTIFIKLFSRSVFPSMSDAVKLGSKEPVTLNLTVQPFSVFQFVLFHAF